MLPNESEIDLEPSDEDNSQNDEDEEVPPGKSENTKDEKSTTATSKT